MSNPGGMTDMEFGALVQEVKTAIKNQDSIAKTLNKLFEKIEENSKEVTVIAASLKSHLELSDLHVADWTKEFKVKDRHDILKRDFVKEKDTNIVHRTAVATTAKNAKWLPIIISVIAVLLGITNAISVWGGNGP